MKKDSMLYNIKLAVDVFNECIAKEQKKHADTMDFIGKSFSGDYRERKKREENNRFTSEIKKLKAECREQTRADLGNIRTRIQNSVKLPDKPDKLNILKSLDSLSLSQAELDILASKSSANYFEQKALAHVAKNHGLSYEFAEITPQIACLDEIDRSISTFLYGGSYTTHTPLGDKRSTVPPVEQANDNYDSMRLLSDRAFDRWDKIFNTGYEKGTPKGQAEQYISVLHNSRTPSENGQIIDNMLKTETNEAVKIELIRQIQNDKALKVFIPYTEKPEIFDIKEDEPKVKPGETLTEAAQRRSEVVADEKRKYHAEVEQKASASASESAH